MKKRLITGFVLAVMMLTMTETSQAANLETLFYKNYQENIITEYSDPFGFYAPGVLEDVYYEGHIALKQADLDGDGTDELLTINIQRDDLTDTNVCTAEVFVLEDNMMTMVSQTTIATDVLSYDEVDCNVFLIPRSNGYFICCENKEEASAIYSDLWWNLCVLTYRNGVGLEEYLDVVIEDASQVTKSKSLSQFCSGMGISADHVISIPIVDQGAQDFIRICEIKRTASRTTQELLQHMNRGDGNIFYYGMTTFKSYANEDLQNKEVTSFPSRDAFDQEDPYLGDDDININFGQNQNGFGYDNGRVQERYSGDDFEIYRTNQRTYREYYEDPYLDDYSWYADEFVFPDSSKRYLTDADLWGLSSWQLRIARNEIYARHGRMFNSTDLSNYFNSTSWYRGTVPAARFNYEYASRVFNEFEVYNIDLIQKYE